MSREKAPATIAEGAEPLDARLMPVVSSTPEGSRPTANILQPVWS